MRLPWRFSARNVCFAKYGDYVYYFSKGSYAVSKGTLSLPIRHPIRTSSVGTPQPITA